MLIFISVGEVRRERLSARPFTWLNNSRGITSNGLSLVHKCLAMHCNFLGLRNLPESEPLKTRHIQQIIPLALLRIILHSLSASEFRVEHKVVYLCQRMLGLLRNERFVVGDGRYIFLDLNFNLVLFRL